MNKANKNLLVRIASAGALIPILGVVVLWNRPEPMLVAVNLAVVIGLVELYWIVLRDDPVWMRGAGVGLGLGVSMAMAWLPHHPEAVTAALVVATLAATVLHLVRFGALESAAARIGLMVFGFIYISLFLTPLGLFKRFPEGSDWIFLVMTVTWFSDTGAYGFGRAFGKRKLYQAVSPGKSVEGALGGLLFSLLAGVLARLWYMPQLGWCDVVLIAIPGGALGQTGDLVESLFKRAYKVKDSGWIIPGHGGLLDRIDALLFCTAYTYIYARFVFFAGA